MPNEAKITRAEQKLRRPKQILEAAFEEFVEHGYVAARVEDIAERVGVTKGTIYVYFETKEVLFSAMIRNIALAFEDILANGKKLEGNCKTRLRNLITLLYDEFLASRRLRELLRFVIAEGSRFPHVIDENHRQFFEPLINFMQSIIDEGVAKGEFKAGPGAVADIAMSPLMMAMVQRLIFDDRREFDRDASIEAHLDMVLNGLLPC